MGHTDTGVRDTGDSKKQGRGSQQMGFGSSSAQPLAHSSTFSLFLHLPYGIRGSIEEAGTPGLGVGALAPPSLPVMARVMLVLAAGA